MLVRHAIAPRPLRRPFPMVGAGWMDIDPLLFRQLEQLIELRQPLRLQFPGFLVKRAVADENPHAVHTQLLHPREIATGGLRVEFLPKLRRPASARTEVSQPKRHEWLAFGGHKPTPVSADPDLRQRRFLRALCVSAQAHAEQKQNNSSNHAPELTGGEGRWRNLLLERTLATRAQICNRWPWQRLNTDAQM